MTIMLDCGGPEFIIQVHGKRYRFEMHPYCGPVALNTRGDPANQQPMAFLEAASLWHQQGQRVEDGLCVWDIIKEAEPVLRHIRGRNYEVIGWHPAPAPIRGS